MELVATLWQRFDRASLGARLFWVAAIAIASHASALRAEFVWLDHAHLEAGLALVRPERFLSSFTQPFAGTGFYRPLMTLSLSADAALGGQPWLYHATNLGWHALASALVVLTAAELGLSQRSATLAGILFAAHPLASLTAAAIAFRSESMLVVALLGLILAHVRQKPLLGAIALLGGALTKETALLLAPLFVVALETHDPTRTRNKRLFLAEAGALGFALVIRQIYAPTWPAGFPALDVSQAVGTRLAALAKSAAAFAFPIDPTVCDAFPIFGPLGPMALFGLAILGVVVFWARARGGLSLLLLCALLPSLQLAPTLRWWSPHYLYVPLAFAVMLAAQRIEARGRNWFAGALALAGVLGAISWLDGRRFQNDGSLWRKEVDRTPACREGNFYLGEVSRKNGDFSDAADAYERALAPHPGTLAYVDVDATLQNLGIARSRLGQLDAAERAFESALLQAHSELTKRKLRHDLASVALQRHDAKKAIRLLAVEAERSDPLPESLALYAKALFAAGRREEAERALARAKAAKIRERE